MDARTLFLYTIDDLEERLALHRNEYGVLMLAALLRKLFLDGTNLVDMVNRYYRSTLVFRANRRDARPFPPYRFWAAGDGFDPETASGDMQAIDLTKDQFLSRPIMGYLGQEIKVRELIEYMANIGGAVHLGSLREKNRPYHAVMRDIEEELLPFQQAVYGIPIDIVQMGFGALAIPVTAQSLKAIARVAIRGLIPLREQALVGHAVIAQEE